MNHYTYKDSSIEIINEPTYSLGSTDNHFNYEKKYFGEDTEGHEPTSKHAVKIIQDDQILYSCILLACGGGTGIHSHSSLLDDDLLLVCCSDTVFCLKLPELDLKWRTKADWATCFQLFKHHNDYIVHGELQIIMLDREGNKKWEFGGADIFVSIDDEKELKLEEDGIVLTDFSKTKYKIDYEGKLLWDTYHRTSY